MSEELDALIQQKIWTIVPPSLNVNIIGNKWVYRIKYCADGFVESFKAGLVAQGYSQQPGLDYTDTFAPVVKLSTVRMVLFLALQHNWFMH